MAFIELIEPAPKKPPEGMALWALGFRPFYLLAALWGAITVPLWAAAFAGWLPLPLSSAWHAHEMVFGYTLAVVVGFLFTAGRNWSGQPTPTGGALAALALLWVAARVAAFTPWPLVAALLNAAFAWLAALGMWLALRGNANRRNDFFVGLLVLVGIAALAWQGRVPTVALSAVVVMLSVMGGRVIPMFSNNAVPTMKARKEPRLEQAALGLVWAVLAADVLAALLGGAPSWLVPIRAGLLIAAAVAHGWRLALWQPLRTLRVPLLWVLHLAYAWLVVHLVLRALGDWGFVAPSLATHALTVGAIGGMTLGMMTRTALGHTARPLVAGPWETAAYGCMALAALMRVVAPLLMPAGLAHAAALSGVLWSAAFVLYLIRYTPMLLRPRLDGKPG